MCPCDELITNGYGYVTGSGVKAFEICIQDRTWTSLFITLCIIVFFICITTVINTRRGD